MFKWYIVVLSAFLVTSSVSNAEITRETDRFTGHLQVSYKNTLATPHNTQVKNRPRLHVLASFSKEGDAEYGMMIFTTTPTRYGWRYMNIESIDWLVDGRRLSLPNPSPRREIASGVLLEAFMLTLNRGHLAALGSAATVEFRIGQDEYRLSTADILAIAEIVATTK